MQYNIFHDISDRAYYGARNANESGGDRLTLRGRPCGLTLALTRRAARAREPKRARRSAVAVGPVVRPRAAHIYRVGKYSVPNMRTKVSAMHGRASRLDLAENEVCAYRHGIDCSARE